MEKRRHANIPIFIPHLGCPNDCVFCNQRTISGHLDFDPSDVVGEIDRALSTIGDRDAEIAFFGGSFTGIDRTLMVSLLDTAQSYVDSDRVTGIRMSTRPDYIDEEIIGILSHYTVSAVELGIQSTDDRLLAACRRGHNTEASERACRMLTEAGFSLVGQMMIGLPEATPASEVKTAEDICAFGASAARVYPTVVFRGTCLCRMAQEGSYTPLSDADAVQRSASVLDVFDRHNVTLLRVGLCASENLSSDEEVYGGANHPAIGELAMGELFFRRICESLGEEKKPRRIILSVAPGAVSKAVGQKKSNIIRLREALGVRVEKVREDRELSGYGIKIQEI